jgi:hypothetical protein
MPGGVVESAIEIALFVARQGDNEVKQSSAYVTLLHCATL